MQTDKKDDNPNDISAISELIDIKPAVPAKRKTSGEISIAKQDKKVRDESKALKKKTKESKKFNEDLQTLVKVLLVFLIFDFATKEFLFQATLPHLKMIEQNR